LNKFEQSLIIVFKISIFQQKLKIPFLEKERKKERKKKKKKIQQFFKFSPFSEVAVQK